MLPFCDLAHSVTIVFLLALHPGGMERLQGVYTVGCLPLSPPREKVFFEKNMYTGQISKTKVLLDSSFHVDYKYAIKNEKPHHIGKWPPGRMATNGDEWRRMATNGDEWFFTPLATNGR